MKQSSFDEDECIRDPLDVDNDSDMPKPPPRSKRNSGWSDEKSNVKNGSGFERQLGNKIEFDDDDDELLAIPDLNEVQEEDLAMQVAQAPNVAVNRVATYKELDNDLFRHAAFSTLDNLNLRVLTRNLAPEGDVKEADCKWTWDLLMTEIATEMNDEYIAS